MAKKTNAQLEAELSVAKAQLESAVKQLDSFKTKVAETVTEMKSEYDLCDDGVADFFDRMGLEQPKKHYAFAFTGTINLVGSDDEISDIFSDIESEVQRLVKGYHEGDMSTRSAFGTTYTPKFELNLDDWYLDNWYQD